MDKTLIALAVAGAFALPLSDAQAQGSVTIYGTLNVNFENFESNGASPIGSIPGNSFVTGTGVNVSSRNQVTSNSSNIGFKGQEDLGGG
jgi:predicted porin